MNERNEYAYLYASGGRRVRVKGKNIVKGENVFEIRAKSIVRMDGSVFSYFLVEQYDEEKGEWVKKGEIKHRVNADLLKHPPEKGKGLTLVCPLGIGGVLCLHDPEPTWECPEGTVGLTASEDEDDD